MAIISPPASTRVALVLGAVGCDWRAMAHVQTRRHARDSYVARVRQYGARLAFGAYIGVGSVCTRNVKPAAILAVLSAIKAERPDLRLHEEVGQLQVAVLAPEAIDIVASGPSAAGDRTGERRSDSVWEPSRGTAGSPALTHAGLAPGLSMQSDR